MACIYGIEQSCDECRMCGKKEKGGKMSKSILVIDTPESCTVCDFYDEGKDECKKNEFAVTFEHSIGDRCPLKPIPEKQYANPMNGYIAGYNACIDEILKESD